MGSAILRWRSVCGSALVPALLAALATCSGKSKSSDDDRRYAFLGYPGVALRSNAGVPAMRVICRSAAPGTPPGLRAGRFVTDLYEISPQGLLSGEPIKVNIELSRAVPLDAPLVALQWDAKRGLVIHNVTRLSGSLASFETTHFSTTAVAESMDCANVLEGFLADNLTVRGGFDRTQQESEECFGPKSPPPPRGSGTQAKQLPLTSHLPLPDTSPQPPPVSAPAPTPLGGAAHSAQPLTLLEPSLETRPTGSTVFRAVLAPGHSCDVGTMGFSLYDGGTRVGHRIELAPTADPCVFRAAVALDKVPGTWDQLVLDAVEWSGHVYESTLVVSGKTTPRPATPSAIDGAYKGMCYSCPDGSLECESALGVCEMADEPNNCLSCAITNGSLTCSGASGGCDQMESAMQRCKQAGHELACVHHHRGQQTIWLLQSADRKPSPPPAAPARANRFCQKYIDEARACYLTHEGRGGDYPDEARVEAAAKAECQQWTGRDRALGAALPNCDTQLNWEHCEGDPSWFQGCVGPYMR